MSKIDRLDGKVRSYIMKTSFPVDSKMEGVFTLCSVVRQSYRYLACSVEHQGLLKTSEDQLLREGQPTKQEPTLQTLTQV